MLIKVKLCEYAVESSLRAFWHRRIVDESAEGLNHKGHKGTPRKSQRVFFSFGLRFLSKAWVKRIDYSYLNASIGFRRAALIAGNIPLMMPTKLRIAVDHSRVAALI